MQKRTLTPYLTLISVIVIVIIVIPALLVIPFSEKKSVAQDERYQEKIEAKVELKSTVDVPVFRMKENEVVDIGLEEYVKGVVASEMPADFELEALKAQALTARTYIVSLLLNPSDIDLPGSAVASDTQQFQVYHSDDELKKIWGKDYNWKMQKITQAVYETQGQIITYEDQPIAAQFFSTSNGYTENSEDYWANAFPYLKSVSSPWDKDSPKFHHRKEFSVQEFNRLLGVNVKGTGKIGKVKEWTAGKRIGAIEIGGKEFTGRKVREELGLSSSDFTIEIKDNTVLIESKGFGHGVGMSQYGANGMAKEGNKYEEIVKYYYKGVSINESEGYVSKLAAVK
jgi:stage II sporulation protein D